MTTTSMRAPIATPLSARETPLDVRAAARELAARTPFRSPESPRGSASARLSGKLPEWLRGDLVRVAPAFGATPNWAPAHWFDALGLAFGFALDGGERVELRWAAFECEMATAAASGKVDLAQFASPNQRGALTRLLQPIPAITDNANVNVQRMGDDLVAMTETPHQLLLDPRTLRVRGRVHYEDKLGQRAMLAHPIIQADKVMNLGFTLNPISEVALYEHHGASRTRRVRARWRTTELPYLHSFGVTERTGIIIDHPLRLRAHRLLWSNQGVISAFRWQPSTGTRLVLMDLHGGGTRVHETDTLFCFHTVHAFETPDATVLDLIAYPDASLVANLGLPTFADGFPAAQSKLTRLSVDRRTGAVTRRTLCELAFEVPQADWDFVGTGEERYVFGSTLRGDAGSVRSDIVRIDAQSGTAQRFAEGDYVFGEPVFVGAPGRSREGDGVLLTVGSGERVSGLFVLDATTLDVLARAEFEVPLPLGFHGSFTPAAK
jgi:carotenoid cleavage dioxygenase-like enzyme